MAKILNGDKRGRPGRWLVDYRDSAGIRRLITVRTRDEAKIELERVLGETRQQTRPACDPNISMSAYAARWLTVLAVRTKPRTRESYETNWRLHLAPRFGTQRVRSVHRSTIQQHLVRLLQGGMARGSVGLIHAVLRAMLSSAIGDGLITSNPADRIGRELKLVAGKLSRQDAVRRKSMDSDQLRRLLTAAAPRPLDWMLLLLLSRTGVRSGECIGLDWTDIDFTTRQITVARAVSRGVESTPKSGHARVIDMSDQLAAALLPIRKDSGPVFRTPAGKRLTEDRIRHIFARARREAGLPSHLTPHCLRHTTASLLIQKGESPAYVQRLLGHANISITVDTYSSLPTDNRAAVNRLDDPGDPVGSKMVTPSTEGTALTAAEVARMIGQNQIGGNDAVVSEVAGIINIEATSCRTGSSAARASCPARCT